MLILALYHSVQLDDRQVEFMTCFDHFLFFHTKNQIRNSNISDTQIWIDDCFLSRVILFRHSSIVIFTISYLLLQHCQNWLQEVLLIKFQWKQQNILQPTTNSSDPVSFLNERNSDCLFLMWLSIFLYTYALCMST